MVNEIIIVDDEQTCLEVMCAYAKSTGFNAKGFELPSEALEYLQTLNTAPMGCLVDMKPYGHIPNNYNPDDYPEAAIPEQIFMYLKDKDWTDNFYFITGGFSTHDRDVINRTGAKYLLKPDPIFRKLDEISES